MTNYKRSYDFNSNIVKIKLCSINIIFIKIKIKLCHFNITSVIPIN